MHKDLLPQRPFRSVVLKHDHYRQRLYFPCDAERGLGMRVLREAESAAERKTRRPPPTKGVVKKVIKKVAKQARGRG